MPGITDVPGVEVFGKGRGEYELPCGFVDENGKVFKKAILREMTGAEEDMMDDDSIPRHVRTTNVLTECIDQLGNLTDKAKIRDVVADEVKLGKGITSTDRIALMVFLRRTSLGDIYKFERRCPCPRQHLCKNRSLDLRTIDIKPVPEDRVGKRRVEVTLPRSSKKVILRVMTAKSEAPLVALRPTSKDLRSVAITARVESIDGQVLDDPRVAIDMVKALTQADREYIRSVYDKMEADVDTSVEVQCDHPMCAAEFSFPLELGQSFFSNGEEDGATEKELRWL